MAKRQVSGSAQMGVQSSPSHGISPSCAKGSDGGSLFPYTEKKTMSRSKAELGDVRKSARLKAKSRLEGENRKKRSETDLSSTGKASRDPAHSNTSSKLPLKPKKRQEAPRSSLLTQNLLPSRQSQTLTRHLAEGQSQENEKHINTTVAHPLESWLLNKRWPSEYFEPNNQTREELLERDSWLEDMAPQPPIPDVQYVEIDGFRYPLPVKRAATSLRRKQSDSSLNEPSKQESRDGKSIPYRNPMYVKSLELKGSFLRDFGKGALPTTVTKPGQDLLDAEQVVPQNSLFRDDLFRRLCEEVQDRNEAMIIQDVSRLLVPSAKNLAIYGDEHLDVLIENVNEVWKGSIPVQGPQPQPDYSVGFRTSAFTVEQLHKLGPLVGSFFDTSFFVATYQMYFPFLTCETKCGAAALDVADRQNAHSMTLAVRGVVELYRAVKREKELNREILAFSVSHDHSVVKIYGHYAVLDKGETTFYRHPIKRCDFTDNEGAEKWTAYKFTKNVYDVWMPAHLKRICSAIDQLPSGLDFEVSRGPGAQPEEATGLSQDMRSILSGPSGIDIASRVGLEGGELIPSTPQTATPDTSISKGGGQRAAKRAKKTSLQNQ